MREGEPMLLVVAPTPLMARDALAAHGLTSDGGRLIRMVTRFTGLRGWRHGIPVIASDVSRWPVIAGYQGAALENTLLTLIACGRMRLARDRDLDQVRAETVQ